MDYVNYVFINFLKHQIFRWMEIQKRDRIPLKYLHLFFKDEQMSYGFGTKWWWVNYIFLGELTLIKEKLHTSALTGGKMVKRLNLFPKILEKKAPDLWRNQICDIKQRESHEECGDQIIDVNNKSSSVFLVSKR